LTGQHRPLLKTVAVALWQNPSRPSGSSRSPQGTCRNCIFNFSRVMTSSRFSFTVAFTTCPFIFTRASPATRLRHHPSSSRLITAAVFPTRSPVTTMSEFGAFPIHTGCSPSGSFFRPSERNVRTGVGALRAFALGGALSPFRFSSSLNFSVSIGGLSGKACGVDYCGGADTAGFPNTARPRPGFVACRADAGLPHGCRGSDSL
jgi:hypothetical protein